MQHGLKCKKNKTHRHPFNGPLKLMIIKDIQRGVDSGLENSRNFFSCFVATLILYIFLGGKTTPAVEENCLPPSAP